MRTWMIAGIALALMTGVASANPCTGTNINNCQNGNDNKINSPSQSQQQQQGQAQGQWSNNVNNNKAYGGAGGSANQSQSNSNTVTNTNTNSNSNSNSATANNSGNNQSVNFEDQKQVGAVAVALAASGPCTGAAGGAAIGTYPVTIGFNYISESDKCNQRELIRISQASTNPEIRARADAALMSMFDAEFGKQNGQQQQGSTSTTPAAIAPQQTASAAVCPDLPMVTHLACVNKASAQ